MPSEFLVTLDNLEFPNSNRYNFREICQSVFDRYYQSFVARLSNAGYQFPPRAYYTAQFGQHLPASFICNQTEGLLFDPGEQNRCLVFINDGEGTVVRVYIVRGVTHRGKDLILLGDAAYGLRVRIEGDLTAVVVVVPTRNVETLTSENVFRL